MLLVRGTINAVNGVRIRHSAAKATTNQFRLLAHTIAYRLLHTLRGLAPKARPGRETQFDTIRLAPIRAIDRC